MQRIRLSELRPGLLVRHIDVGRILVMMIKVGLVFVITASLVFGVAVRTGSAPEFDQQIVLNPQHILVIHNGPSPSCTSTPNPPQHDCFRPGRPPREFSVYYLAPQGARSLLWFRLP
jgi:hypothetical protein